jgi:hypothetical protein
MSQLFSIDDFMVVLIKPLNEKFPVRFDSSSLEKCTLYVGIRQKVKGNTDVCNLQHIFDVQVLHCPFEGTSVFTDRTFCRADQLLIY